MRAILVCLGAVLLAAPVPAGVEQVADIGCGSVAVAVRTKGDVGALYIGHLGGHGWQLLDDRVYMREPISSSSCAGIVSWMHRDGPRGLSVYTARGPDWPGSIRPLRLPEEVVGVQLSPRGTYVACLTKSLGLSVHRADDRRLIQQMGADWFVHRFPVSWTDDESRVVIFAGRRVAHTDPASTGLLFSYCGLGLHTAELDSVPVRHPGSPVFWNAFLRMFVAIEPAAGDHGLGDALSTGPSMMRVMPLFGPAAVEPPRFEADRRLLIADSWCADSSGSTFAVAGTSSLRTPAGALKPRTSLVKLFRLSGGSTVTLARERHFGHGRCPCIALSGGGDRLVVGSDRRIEVSSGVTGDLLWADTPPRREAGALD